MNLMDWLRKRFTRSDRDAEIREELEFHLAARADQARDSGASTPEAAARKRFGSPAAAMEATREVWRRAWLDHLRRDTAYALRGFRRSPAFFLAATGTLAIGIGAATAIFSVVDPILFRSLPYPKSHELVSVGYFGPVDTNEFTVVSSYLDWRREAATFLTLTSMRPSSPCDLTTGAPTQINCIPVESNFLTTLGFRPQSGRDFTIEDDKPGAPPVGLVSHALWQKQFGGDPRMIGRTIIVDEAPVRVIGILPETFEMPQLGEADVLLAERLNPSLARGANSSGPLRAFGRLRPGVSIDQARARMDPLMTASAKADVPATLLTEIHNVVRSLRERQIHEVQVASWMLLGVVAALLLIACANVANLLLARWAARTRELALRTAIGAGRWNLIRQTLTESTLLALVGGAAGSALGWLLLRGFLRLAPAGIPRLEHAGIDPRILAFALVASLAAALFFGLWPALETKRASQLNVRPAGTPPTNVRWLLVSLQVAVSLVLLSGSSLMLRSLTKLQSQALGFQPARLLSATFTLRQQKYGPPGAQAAFYTDLEERMARVAGSAFAISDSVPLIGGGLGRPYSNMKITGRPPVQTGGGMVTFRWVTPSYFRTLRIPITAGRAFTESERASGEPPLILSANLARKMFPGENPVGQYLQLEGDGKQSQIVGVAADVKNTGIDVAPNLEYYRLRMKTGRMGGRTAAVLVQSSLPPAAITALVQREFAAADPTLPVKFESMETRVDRLQSRPRFLALLITLFAASGLLLAGVGLYGVLAFLVTQKTREIGVRMALGATPSHVRWQMQRQASPWVLAGIAAGLVSALALSSYISSLLFEVAPNDPWAIGEAALVLAAAGAFAAWIPSHRASRVDPAIALRAD